MANIFKNIPENLDREQMLDLLKSDSVRIERIVSCGQSSPETGWYDQDESEWVIILEGSGTIEFESGESVSLNRGDYVCIPAHQKHRVCWTDPNQTTIWLAVFY